MIRRLRADSDPSVIVQSQEDLRILIPIWMLDEAHCREMATESRPRVSVAALAALRALIDAQDLRSGGEHAGCDCVVVHENNHESIEEGSDAVSGPSPDNA